MPDPPAMPMVVPAVRGWIVKLPLLCKRSPAEIPIVLAFSTILLEELATDEPAFQPTTAVPPICISLLPALPATPVRAIVPLLARRFAKSETPMLFVAAPPIPEIEIPPPLVV